MTRRESQKVEGSHNRLVGERIKAIRKALGITQKEFGDAIGVNDTLIAHIEKGKKRITISTLVVACRRFNISADYVLFGDGNPEKPLKQEPPQEVL